MISPERLEFLQTQWIRLVEPLGIALAPAYELFDRIVAAYSEPHRHYHTLEHIAEMLKISGRLAKHATNPAAVQLAIWLHDIVYDPKRRDNEEQSATLATVELAKLGLDRSLVETVATLIRSTEHLGLSTNAMINPDTDVILDADLAILASGEARYRRYVEGIRAEYQHVPEPEFRNGRIEVLKQFLARPRLYRTAILALEGEAAARRNLSAELEELQSSSTDGVTSS